MKKITNDIIEELVRYKGEDVMTIYIPTHRFPTPPNLQEDQTRYKNLIHTVSHKWFAGAESTEKSTVIRQLEEKIDDVSFWQHTTETLAVFASTSGAQFYHMPIECEERIYVGSTYDITPLLVIKELNRPFYIFTLAVHNSKLFRGDIYDLEPVELDFPSSPEAALNIDETYSANSKEATGGDSGSPRGQGDANHAEQEERRKYFRIIDNLMLKSHEVDTTLPILIAATDSEASEYKAISKLPRLVETHIHGNHTMATLKDLHVLALRMIREGILYPMMRSKIDRFYELVGLHKASDDLADIIVASEQERVDCLMVCMLNLTTDSVSDNTENTLLIKYPDFYDKDNILQLIRSVVLQGGTIVGIDRALMAKSTKVAAIYRY